MRGLGLYCAKRVDTAVLAMEASTGPGRRILGRREMAFHTLPHVAAQRQVGRRRAWSPALALRLSRCRPSILTLITSGSQQGEAR